MREYSADAPLRAIGEDRFQRWPFAQRIAKAIVARTDPDSIVVGINGAWGEGKTTVFNFIQEELNKHANVVHFKFNPWRFPEESKLIKDFFSSLAQALDKQLEKKHEKYASKLKDAIDVIKPFVGSAAEAASAATGFISSVDLETLKYRVEALLIESGKRVVILMDDLDRLDKYEIQTVFRLVKLVADFRNTAYILAFDSEVVASALQERYSDKSPDAGRNFLQKIVQVPLDLPQVPTFLLREYCLSNLEQLFSNLKINLSQEEVNRFVRGFDNGILVRIRTPRAAKRYANIVSFILPILDGEVNQVDLLLIEGVRVFYPALYKFVKSNIDLVVPASDSREVENHNKSQIEAVLEDLSDEEKNAAINLLRELFPKVNAYYGGLRHSNDIERTWQSKRLITSKLYFQRYFSYSVPQGQVSDQAYSAFIESVDSLGEAELMANLKQLIGSKNASYMTQKLKGTAESIGALSAKKLATAISKDGSLFPVVQGLFTFNGPFTQAARLVADLIARVSLLEGDEVGRRTAIDIVKTAEPLRFASEIVGWLRFEKANGDDKFDRNSSGQLFRKAFPVADKQVIGGYLAERIVHRFSQTDAVASMSVKEFVHFLVGWATFRSKSETTEFLSGIMEADPSFAIKLVEAFCSTWFNHTTGLPSEDIEFERSDYTNLSRVVDANLVASHLNEVFGPYVHADRFPRSYGPSGEAALLILANQFRWIHHLELEEVSNQFGSDQGASSDVADDAAWTSE